MVPDPADAQAVAALARTLQSEVEGLQPGDRLTELRGRVRRDSRRSWAQATVAALVAAAVVTAVAVSHERALGPSTSAPATDPTASRSVPATLRPPGLISDPHPLPVYYLGRDGERWALYREFHRRTLTESQPNRLTAALRAATTAGTAVDPDLSIPWSSAASRSAITVGDGLVTVNLPAVEGQRRGRTAEQARLAVQQLVWTASAVQQDGALKVRLLIAGRPGLLFGAEPVGTAVERAAAADAVLGSVWVHAPDEDQHLVSPVTVRGSVCALGSSLSWQLWRDGVLLRSGTTPVADRCPARAAWSVKLGDLEPGRYTLRAFEPAAPDARSERADSRAFSVR